MSKALLARRRIGRVRLSWTILLAGTAFLTAACNAILGIGELTPPPQGDGGQPAEASADAALDSEQARADVLVPEGPTDPEDVLSISTVDDFVVGRTMHLLIRDTSLVSAVEQTHLEQCDPATCALTRTIEVASAQMPGEQSPYFRNTGLAVLVGPTSASRDAVLVAQTGNVPCTNGSCAVAPESPAVYLVNGPTPRVSLARMASAGTWTTNNVVNVRSGADGVWFASNLQAMSSPTYGETLLVFSRTDPADGSFDVTLRARREDKRNSGPQDSRYYLAGMQRNGAAFVTRPNGYYGELTQVALSSPDAAADRLIDISRPRTLVTTGSLIFVRTADTPEPDRFLRATSTGTPGLISIAGITAESTVVGTELGLLWYTSPLPDAGAAKITLHHCPDATLAVTPPLCVPRNVDVALESIDAVRCDGSYLYVLGNRSGSHVIVRFRP